MNKQEYLEKLESCLKHKLSREEIEDIMRDYAEYFEEGRRQSKSDSEISAKLGTPELVAQQLIEENQEQKSDYAAAHGQDKKKPWDSAKGYWEVVKTTFHEWDKGEGNTKKGTPSKEKIQEEKSDRKQKIKQAQSSDNLLIRFIKCCGRAVRWCVYALIALTLLFCAAGVTFFLLGAAAAVFGLLAGAEAVSVFLLLISILGVILSGFGFAFYPSWGAAILMTSIAGIGFCSLISILLFRTIGSFWSFTKSGLRKGGWIWLKVLKKIESWLILPADAAQKAAQTGESCEGFEQQDKPESDEEEKAEPCEEERFSVQQTALPSSLPIQAEQEEPNREGF